MSYVTPTALATQIGYRDLQNPRLQVVCDDATAQINDHCGKRDGDFDPVHPTIQNIALSLAVDIWKQPDATFGIMGLSETGPVRVARGLILRYEQELLPFKQPETGWGVA